MLEALPLEMQGGGIEKRCSTQLRRRPNDERDVSSLATTSSCSVMGSVMAEESDPLCDMPVLGKAAAAVGVLPRSTKAMRSTSLVGSPAENSRTEWCSRRSVTG